MDRTDAVALLREITDKRLVEPSFISIEKNKHGTYNLIIKGESDIKELKELVAGKNLVIEEDKKGNYVIYKH